jgi:hypothetical protein
MKQEAVGENCIIKSFKYNQNDQVKEDEMGRVHGMSGGEEECI